MFKKHFKYSTKPLRMWIDGTCFNIQNFNREKGKTKQNVIVDSENKIISEGVEIKDIEYENQIDVLTDDDGNSYLSFNLPPIYYRKLYQLYDEFNISHLCAKTQTSISWPGCGMSTTGNLVIKGNDEGRIKNALTEIHAVIGAIREQLPAAQFISIPILSPEVKDNFEKFKSIIVNAENINGMHETIFQSVSKLHLTTIVLALSDDREKTEAINTLEEYKKTILSPLLEKTGPLKLRIEGIDCMDRDYKKANVLYANVKIINESEEVSLQKIVNDLANFFYDRGLVLKYTDNIKLHMTLMNTKYRHNPNPQRKKWVRRDSFDASKIIEKYKDFVFGECNLDSIHLSLISSKGEDGFYKPLSVIKV